VKKTGGRREEEVKWSTVVMVIEVACEKEKRERREERVDPHGI
jgi:hypothetical protein